MRNFIQYAFSKSRTVYLALIFFIVSGLYAYFTIPKEATPDISIPIIYVFVELRGISPDDAERLLVKPLENELRNVEGIKEFRSSAYAGGANVIMEFDVGFDVEQALSQVRQKVDNAKAELPDEAEEPHIEEVNLSEFPVLSVVLSGDLPERTLLKLANDLQEDIQVLPQVLEVQLIGDRKEQVEIIVDPLKLESYGLGNSQILANIKEFNQLIAAGSLINKEGSFEINVKGLFQDVQDIMNMPILTQGDAVIKLQDIAIIKKTFEDPVQFARVNGKKSLTLDIKKRSGHNVIKTIETVKSIVANAQKEWPDAVKITYTGDQSQHVRDMLSDLQNNILIAILLVMLIIVVTMGWKSASLVGIAIPGSFLMGLLALHFFGLSMNNVVLFSLILSTGLLVDGAIVLVENANTHMMAGLSPYKAFQKAALFMAWPITASTLTTIAAFLPLLFWPGVMGEFMQYLPLTLIAILVSALFMALIFVPVIGGRFKFSKRALEKQDVILPFVNRYEKILSWALDHAKMVILGSFAVLFSIYVLYGQVAKGVILFPEVEPERLKIVVHAQGNLSIYEKDALVKEVEDILLTQNQTAHWFKTVYSQVGTTSDKNQTADTIGSIFLDLTDWDTRPKAEFIKETIRAKTQQLAGIKIEVLQEEEGPSQGKPIEIELTSSNQQLLIQNALTLYNFMQTQEGLVNLEHDLSVPGVEWKITINRAQAAKFSADVGSIGAAIQLITNGLQITSFRPQSSKKEVEIVVRLPEQYRTLHQLDTMRLTTSKGNVPISHFVEREAQPKTGTIYRKNGNRSVTLKADVTKEVLPPNKIAEIQAWLEKNPLDKNIQIVFKGDSEEEKESGDFLMKAFFIAVFLILIILVSEFNSYFNSLLILSAVLMSTIGVLIGLMVMGQEFQIVMGGIGIIALAGVIVNNNIILIDTFEHFRKDYATAKEAILATGRQRLRPVLLTTITTSLGLLPMLLQVNINIFELEVSHGAPSTEWWVQLATCMVFGLLFATVLTLIVTPCCLYLKARRTPKAKKPLLVS